MPKFYKVKPEFAARTIRYKVPDKRKKEGYRTEQVELVENELFYPKEYNKIISYNSLYSDAFQEVTDNQYNLYRLFGVLYSIKDAGCTIEEREEKIREAKILRTSLRTAYYKIKHIYPDEKLLAWLSIETLQECLNYYSSLVFEVIHND